MKRHDKLKRLRTLQAELDTLRRKLHVSDRNDVLYLASIDDRDEEMIVVADGFGGATASIVEGNYPIDFITRYEKEFVSESAALRAAEKVVDEQFSPAEVLV
jgi:hypothetical protein